MAKSRVTTRDREPEVFTDEFGIVWTERYSVWTANIGGIIPASVSWEAGSWKIRIANREMKNNAESAEKGRQRAVAYIKQQLRPLFRTEFKFWAGTEEEGK